VLGSCSGSVRGSGFEVHRSAFGFFVRAFAVRPLREPFGARRDSAFPGAAGVTKGFGRLKVLHQACDLLQRRDGERIQFEPRLLGANAGTTNGERRTSNRT
jgi:hypothetical protein